MAKRKCYVTSENYTQQRSEKKYIISRDGVFNTTSGHAIILKNMYYKMIVNQEVDLK